MGDLLDYRTIRALADSIGLKPTKTRGQNFVTDANTVRRIVSLADISDADHIVEVGPGLGSLTLGLVEKASHLSVIEIDSLLASQLPSTIRQINPGAISKVDIITADALDVDTLPAGDPDILVANLPYNVSVPVILHMLEYFPSLRSALVMVQLEVADRLVASPGSKIYGVPSAKLAWYAEAQRVGTVPPTVFWPIPNVDSGLVRITRRSHNYDVDRHIVFDVIDEAFNQRRKMLRSALAKFFGSSARATAALERAGIDPTWRGERLTIDDFVRIAAEVDTSETTYQD